MHWTARRQCLEIALQPRLGQAFVALNGLAYYGSLLKGTDEDIPGTTVPI